ncbi:hypothetical protein GDO86_019063 [Hymenochirus boettgeri]|uniref:Uncharacterized protein n=1 Tax=Hymenochirus boettgeri TaxID=247094 RepID=A0A8T2IFA4_9PIPI|nr:hypothetical protein GDO86_019063 [Hymenochirus boettgeri]
MTVTALVIRSAVPPSVSRSAQTPSGNSIYCRNNPHDPIVGRRERRRENESDSWRNHSTKLYCLSLELKVDIRCCLLCINLPVSNKE